MLFDSFPENAQPGGVDHLLEGDHPLELAVGAIVLAELLPHAGPVELSLAVLAVELGVVGVPQGAWLGAEAGGLVVGQVAAFHGNIATIGVRPNMPSRLI